MFSGEIIVCFYLIGCAAAIKVKVEITAIERKAFLITDHVWAPPVGHVAFSCLAFI